MRDFQVSKFPCFQRGLCIGGPYDRDKIKPIGVVLLLALLSYDVFAPTIPHS